MMEEETADAQLRGRRGAFLALAHTLFVTICFLLSSKRMQIFAANNKLDSIKLLELLPSPIAAKYFDLTAK